MQEGQGEAAAGHMDADAQDFDPDVLNLLACPAPHGKHGHTRSHTHEDAACIEMHEYNRVHDHGRGCMVWVAARR